MDKTVDYKVGDKVMLKPQQEGLHPTEITPIAFKEIFIVESFIEDMVRFKGGRTIWNEYNDTNDMYAHRFTCNFTPKVRLVFSEDMV
jgi:hypothetical protein